MIFFAVAYPNHLHFQEQYQLFLFDWKYVGEILSWPGGVADLIGRFFTQFFLYAWAGAVIIGLLLAAIHWLTLRLLAASPLLSGLSLIPATLLWIFLCDENALIGAIVAVLLAQIAAWAMGLIPHGLVRCLMILVAMPLIYWAIGPVVILFCVLCFVEEARRKGKMALYKIILLSVTLLGAFIAPLAAYLQVALPLEKLYFGAHYFRYPQIVPTMLWYAVAALVLISLIGLIALKRNPNPVSAEVKRKKSTMAMSLSIVAIGIICGSCIQLFYNPSTEEMMSYDFMARHQQWNRIISTANHKSPNNPVSCTALNLALCIKGRMPDHMFDYKQNNIDGLLPLFVRDPFSPLTTAEAYYHIGMINTAQRFVFEAQEAIPDFQKSARCYKRLAETNLINESYEVARKYLEPLQKTLFYRSWAKQTLQLVKHPETIAQNSDYEKMRQIRCNEDYLYSDQELPQMLGKQLMSNRHNRLAYEYLQAAFLLSGNLESFSTCINLGSELGYHDIPKHYQEALMLWWSHNHGPEEQMPRPLNPEIMNGMQQFYSMWNRSDKEAAAKYFGRTYWYYFFSMLQK